MLAQRRVWRAVGKRSTAGSEEASGAQPWEGGEGGRLGCGGRAPATEALMYGLSLLVAALLDSTLHSGSFFFHV